MFPFCLEELHSMFNTIISYDFSLTLQNVHVLESDQFFRTSEHNHRSRTRMNSPLATNEEWKTRFFLFP